MSTRTAAETERSRQIKDYVSREVRQKNAHHPRELNLTLLPIETKFSLCTLKVDGGAIAVEDDKAEVARLLAIKSNAGTLRQVAHSEFVRPDMRAMVLNAKMPYSRIGNHRRKRSFRVSPSGTNLQVDLALYQHTQTRTSTSDVYDLMLASITRSPEDFTFIGQHTLRFPATYFNRAAVSFLGLPSGTIVPLKNGGKFEVAQRDKILVDVDGNVSGELLLMPLDDKATKLVGKMGWSATMVIVDGRGRSAFRVPSNLWTKQRDGQDFDTAAIVVPYKCPLHSHFPQFFISPTTAPVYVPPTTPMGKAMIWRTDSAAFADSLDDFLFG